MIPLYGRRSTFLRLQKPPRGDSFRFITKSQGVRGPHLVDFGKMNN